MVTPVPLHATYVIAVGDELLNGRTSDTNSTTLQRRLLRRGVRVAGTEVVPDEASALRAALSRLPAGSLVLVTGGLGPTPDDLTAATVAAWGNVTLTEREDVTRQLRELCEQRGWSFGPNMVKQTLVPAGLVPLLNRRGTAPAMCGELGGRTLVVLPGPPAEIDGLWPDVEDWLERSGRLGPATASVRLRTVRIPEPVLARETAPLAAAHPQLAWSWWLGRWGVDVQASAVDGGALPAGLEADLVALLGDFVWGRDEEELPAVVVDALRACRRTVAVAESCTGGLLGAALTETAGASDVFVGGFLTYADAAKQALLGVEPEILAEHGAVSAACALAMAAGARTRLGADHALAITGVAGPDGGTAAKPVGITWIALAGPAGAVTGRFRFTGDRARNRRLAVAAALDALRRHLRDGCNPFDAPDLWR
jgi:nicotinamide-nucleotide amidase